VIISIENRDRRNGHSRIPTSSSQVCRQHKPHGSFAPEKCLRPIATCSGNAPFTKFSFQVKRSTKATRNRVPISFRQNEPS
jgi:hypothetical protein